MKRKLVQQGTSTLMVSIPSKWARANDLTKGSEVEVEEKGKEIIITPTLKEASTKKISLDASGYDILTNRLIVSLYIKGYEEVELQFKDREEMKKIKKHVLNELLGFEVIKQEGNKIIIRDLIDEKQNIDDIIKRIFFIIDGMLQDLVDEIKQKQKLDEIISLDSSINKLVHFSLRILNSRGYADSEKTSQFYGIISIFEQIGDLIKQLITDIKKEKITNQQVEVIKKIREIIKTFEKITFHFKKEEAVKFAKQYEEIKNSIKKKTHIDLTLKQINEAIIRMNNYLMVSVI